MKHETHVTELLPGYALDCLEAEEALMVASHLTKCAQCREELASYRAVTGQLAMAVPDMQPPDTLKATILRAIQPEIHSQSAKSSFRERWQGFVAFFQPIAPAWSLSSAVIIVVLGISTAIFWQRLNTLEEFYHTQDFQLVKLECTHIVPAATGQIVVSNDGEIGSLAVAHLPALEPGQVYQVWLTMDGRQMNGGTFTVNAQGYGALNIKSPQSLLDCGIHITVEPEQGSGQPSGETVLQMMI
jgi:anti-sigma-K factor RskA